MSGRERENNNRARARGIRRANVNINGKVFDYLCKHQYIPPYNGDPIDFSPEVEAYLSEALYKQFHEEIEQQKNVAVFAKEGKLLEAMPSNINTVEAFQSYVETINEEMPAGDSDFWLGDILAWFGFVCDSDYEDYKTWETYTHPKLPDVEIEFYDDDDMTRGVKNPETGHYEDEDDWIWALLYEKLYLPSINKN